MINKKYVEPPTQEEKELAAQKRQALVMERRRLDAEMATIYSGNLCQICGRRHMTGAVCRRYRGSICMKHCRTCKYFNEQFWHCSFHE